MLALAVALASGCDDTPNGAATASAPSARVPAGLPEPAVEVDGRRLPVRSLLAYSRGGAAVQLIVSTHPIGCEQIDNTGTLEQAGETTLDLTLAPRLGTDGKSTWTVTRARLGAITRQGKLGTASVSAFDPRAKVKGSVDTRLVFPPAMGGTKRREVRVHGRIEAEGCGLRPYAADAKVRRQKDLSVEIAGEPIPMTGASLVRAEDGGLSLLLTSEPHACAAGALGADIAVTLDLSPDATSVSRATIEGYALAGQRNAKDVQSLAVRLATPLDGAEVVGLELDGVTEVGGYRLALHGAADAAVCEKRGP